jgi:UDPglucose--hexose-1-phosphate uridylyltransferase
VPAHVGPRNLIAMSERRHDPLSGHDVIVAAGRAARPTSFAPASPDTAGPQGCPFCPGHEAETPPEVARIGPGAPDTPGWRVRAFPNLYPIVDTHEVVVLSPDHQRSFAGLDDNEAVEVLTMLRDRVHTHLQAGHVYSVAILNHLRAAGASLAHPHAQVFALDAVPAAVDEALARVRAAGTDLVVDDAVHADLVVASDGQVTLWCPYAATAPYQLRLAHGRAGARFDEAADEVIADVAIALRDGLRRLRSVLGDAPYNVIVPTAPLGDAPFHWYVEVVPRLTVVAGFEQATGILVNTVPPDVSAHELRGVAP